MEGIAIRTALIRSEKHLFARARKPHDSKQNINVGDEGMQSAGDLVRGANQHSLLRWKASCRRMTSSNPGHKDESALKGETRSRRRTRLQLIKGQKGKKSTLYTSFYVRRTYYVTALLVFENQYIKPERPIGTL